MTFPKQERSILLPSRGDIDESDLSISIPGQALDGRGAGDPGEVLSPGERHKRKKREKLFTLIILKHFVKKT